MTDAEYNRRHQQSKTARRGAAELTRLVHAQFTAGVDVTYAELVRAQSDVASSLNRRQRRLLVGERLYAHAGRKMAPSIKERKR